jgi:HK97 gp10 family phage protein
MGYISNLDDVKRALREAIKRGLGEAGALVERDARQLCPVDSGHLERSITYKVQEDSVVIGTNIEYAPYVEFGTGIYAAKGDGRSTPWGYETEEGEHFFTRGQKPQPFLEPALVENKENVQRIIRQEIEASLGG